MRRSTIRAGALAGIVLASACGSRPRVRAEYLRAVTAAEATLEEAWRRFDAAAARSDWVAARNAAGHAAAAAVRARDVLEALRPQTPFDTALREELVFLNHVIPGYRGFAAGEANAVELAKLRSILRRGRIHQQRGRDSLR